ncbi:hypothetical protein AB0G74_04075 [Streptomyces sp. NPDC020875]|uniref:hypothetical protein n=1 Tax=Streptomyces sp. NPDC020875 TaxID=3154898 RepID=UPI0033F3D6A8
MTRRASARPRSPGKEIKADGLFAPRLGDLALDIGKGGRVGVVTALPGDSRKTYELCSPDGVSTWSSSRDGTSLHPIPPATAETVARTVAAPSCRICGTPDDTRRVASVPTPSGGDRPVYGCPVHAETLRQAVETTLRAAEALTRVMRGGAS